MYTPTYWSLLCACRGASPKIFRELKVHRPYPTDVTSIQLSLFRVLSIVKHYMRRSSHNCFSSNIYARSITIKHMSYSKNSLYSRVMDELATVSVLSPRCVIPFPFTASTSQAHSMVMMQPYNLQEHALTSCKPNAPFQRRSNHGCIIDLWYSKGFTQMHLSLQNCSMITPHLMGGLQLSTHRVETFRSRVLSTINASSTIINNNFCQHIP